MGVGGPDPDATARRAGGGGEPPKRDVARLDGQSEFQRVQHLFDAARPEFGRGELKRGAPAEFGVGPMNERPCVRPVATSAPSNCASRPTRATPPSRRDCIDTQGGERVAADRRASLARAIAETDRHIEIMDRMEHM